MGVPWPGDFYPDRKTGLCTVDVDLPHPGGKTTIPLNVVSVFKVFLLSTKVNWGKSVNFIIILLFVIKLNKFQNWETFFTSKEPQF